MGEQIGQQGEASVRPGDRDPERVREETKGERGSLGCAGDSGTVGSRYLGGHQAQPPLHLQDLAQLTVSEEPGALAGGSEGRGGLCQVLTLLRNHLVHSVHSHSATSQSGGAEGSLQGLGD